MFMALMARFFKRGGSNADRTIELQDKPEIDVVPEPELLEHEPAFSSPKVVHFSGRIDLLERGYWSSHKPRRVRRINLEPEVAAEPGATRRVNRLLRRGYYRSLRHAA